MRRQFTKGHTLTPGIDPSIYFASAERLSRPCDGQGQGQKATRRHSYNDVIRRTRRSIKTANSAKAAE